MTKDQDKTEQQRQQEQQQERQRQAEQKQQQTEQERQRERQDNPTTYPPTPGDRNEEERAKRGFGRPQGEELDTPGEGPDRPGNG
jgi:hypothetical protein